MAIILASSSPRRKELLRKSVSSFDVIPANIDESVKPKELPKTYVARMAKEKALAIANHHPDDIVIGCDTSVIIGNSILGKPGNDTEARFMLKRLSNLTHQVLTSVYIKTPDKVYQKTEVVQVKFYPLSEADIDAYLKTTTNTTIPVACNGTHISCFTSIVPTAQTNKLIIPAEHKYQLILKEGDSYTEGGGFVGGQNDFTGYVAKAGSSTNGYLSVNHETNPGGVTMAEINYNATSKLWQLTKSRAVSFSD
ncbi:MAG: Maf family protein, partial [Vagococcus sp.]